MLGVQYWDLLLHGKWIASDDEQFQIWQLGHRIIKLVLRLHLIKGEVELLKAREYLVLKRQVDVVFRELRRVELSEFIAPQVKLFQVGNRGEGLDECIRIDERGSRGKVVLTQIELL